MNLQRLDRWRKAGELPDRCAEPIRLSRNNLGLKLVQAARDEAHRFAQHYHHILRRKRVIGE